MFPSYLPVKAPDPGAYHFNFLGHNQKCLTPIFFKKYKTLPAFKFLPITSPLTLRQSILVQQFFAVLLICANSFNVVSSALLKQHFDQS